MPKYFIDCLGDGTIAANSPEEAERKFKSLFARILRKHTSTQIGLPKGNIKEGWVSLYRANIARLLRKGFRVKEFNGT